MIGPEGLLACRTTFRRKHIICWSPTSFIVLLLYLHRKLTLVATIRSKWLG